MKKLLLGFFILLNFVVAAQEKNYDDLWKKIDSLEANGKVRSADELNQELLQKASQNKDFTAYIKGKIYYYRLYQINHEIAEPYILNDLNREISRLPSPFKNILLSYKAEMLSDFFIQNRWTIKNRGNIDDPNSKDIATWSLETLQDSIKTSYFKSLNDSKTLSNTPNSSIALLLSENPVNRKFQPGIYDLLSQRLLDYLSDSSFFPSEFKDGNTGISEEILFSVNKEFYTAEVQDLDTSTSLALKQFQELERLHTEANDITALGYWKMQRLKFIKEKIFPNANTQYLKALQQLAEGNTDENVKSLVSFEIANYYYQESQVKNEDDKLRNPDFLIRSMEYLEKIVSEFPNTIGAQNAIRLRTAIKEPILNSKGQNFLASQEPGRIYLSYKNVDTLYYKIFPITSDYFSKISYNQRTRFIAEKALKIKDSSKVILPGNLDYNTHSTEIAFPGKSYGEYMAYFYDLHGTKSYLIFTVTDLAVSKTAFQNENIFHVMDRKTGKNLEDVSLQLKSNGKVIQTKKTDQNGEVSLKTINSYLNRKSILFLKGPDTLETNYSRQSYYRHNEGSQPIKARTLFFLDRAIYRPGQKVHFKGILLKHENDFTSTVPNEFIEVYVDDPNGKEVQKFRFKTNNYGSFSGSFNLPENGITGSFRIYTEEDMDSETAFWNKVWDNGDFLDSGKSFSVEEYKRPTFEVSFDSIKKTFKLQDTVKLTGKAKSYMGATLPEVKVIYEIKREKMIYSWWRRYYSDAVIIKTDSVNTDSNGDFEISFIAEAKKDAIENEELIYKYSIVANVTDITGETRSGNKELKIGNRNLLTELQFNESLNLKDTLNLSLKTTNLNDNTVPVKGIIKIFRLKTPDRVLKKRLWEAPEFNLLTEQEFKELFPNEPYGDNPSPENWPKHELIYQTEFISDGLFEEDIKTSKWKEGSYLVELKVEDDQNKAEAKKIFEISDKDDKYLNNGQALQVRVLNKTSIKQDGFAKVQIKTAYKDLNLRISAFSGEKKSIFKQFLKVNGTATVKISIDKLQEAEFKLLVNGVRDNTKIQHTDLVNFQASEEPLNITTKTFRDKIRPGLEETWSFSVEGPDKKADAEVLASMYDMSLDQFKTDSWDIKANMGYRYSNYPDFQFTNIGNPISFSNQFSYSRGFREQLLNFDRLKSFGFSFSANNSWTYRNYLRSLKQTERQEMSGNIRGRIIDSEGTPIPGVNVRIKGTSTGTTTNFDGEFALNAKKGDVLIIAFIGYKTIEYTITNEEQLYLTLDEDSASLDEVVVTGLAVAEDVEMVGTETDMLLQGKVSGVQISSTGAATQISIRGTSSAGTGNPIFIVDGKPVESYDLDPEDILTVEILKGAEATALYGSRAKDGVVIITTKKGLADFEKVEARKDLDETAFFFPDLKLAEDGTLEFSFTTPEALTSWKLRLLAHTNSWNTGKLEKTVITQKELNVSPNPPRFLREGDTIYFKAKISNLSQETLTGNAVLKLFNAITMEPVDAAMNNLDNLRNFRMNASESDLVSWKLLVPDTIPAITYRILAKAGDFSDGEENLLPVLKNKMLVKESIPFFVRAGETEDYVFENLKNNTSETLQNHQFTIEYTSNPVWYAIQSLPYLMEYEHECSEQIFARIFANVVGNKIVSSQPMIAEVFEKWEQDSTLASNLEKNEDLISLLLAETPWVRDAASETAQKNRVAKLFDTEKMNAEIKKYLAKLIQMQSSSGAFPWFSGGRDNFYITKHIVTGLGKLKDLEVEIDDRRITSNAIRFLDAEILKLENNDFYEKKEDFYKSNTALVYCYTRSYHLKEFPLPEGNSELVKNILKHQKEDWLQLPLMKKGMLALTLHSNADVEPAKNILRSLKETAVYSEDYGMYWKENTASWRNSSTPVENQALLIEAFSKVLKDQEAVEEMKIWLLQNKRTNHWATTKSTTEAAYALLMQGQELSEINDGTLIKVGNKPIDTEKLKETKVEAGTGYLKVNWKAEEVEKGLAEIQIKNENSTAGYGGAYWQYFEDLDKIQENTESPLNIEKELYLNKANNQLQKITSKTPLKLGDLVTVRLVVRSQADMDFIHLKDMRASGFEPTDVLSEYKYQDGTAYYQSTRDAATHFFFDSLRKGTYVLEYTVRANNAGEFSNGITLIESMYAPEFSGHTKGIRVEIGDNK